MYCEHFVLVLCAMFDPFVGKFRIKIRTMLSPWNTKSSSDAFIHYFSYTKPSIHHWHRLSLRLCCPLGCCCYLCSEHNNKSWCMFPVCIWPSKEIRSNCEDSHLMPLAQMIWSRERGECGVGLISSRSRFLGFCLCLMLLFGPEVKVTDISFF